MEVILVAAGYPCHVEFHGHVDACASLGARLQPVTIAGRNRRSGSSLTDRYCVKSNVIQFANGEQ